MNKKIITNQQYEDYWDLTMAWTDYKNTKFTNALSLIVKFIDDWVDSSIGLTAELYQNLQNRLSEELGITGACPSDKVTYSQLREGYGWDHRGVNKSKRRILRIVCRRKNRVFGSGFSAMCNCIQAAPLL